MPKKECLILGFLHIFVAFSVKFLIYCSDSTAVPHFLYIAESRRSRQHFPHFMLDETNLNHAMQIADSLVFSEN